MWCIETIVSLNQKAMEMYIQGRHLADAYAAVGINAEFVPETSEICSESELTQIIEDLQENKNVELASSRWI